MYIKNNTCVWPVIKFHSTGPLEWTHCFIVPHELSILQWRESKFTKREWPVKKYFEITILDKQIIYKKPERAQTNPNYAYKNFVYIPLYDQSDYAGFCIWKHVIVII